MTLTAVEPSADTTDEPIAEACPIAPDGMHGYISDQERYLRRINRIEGQVRGIGRMIDDERYCIDILTQISAITNALEGVALGLLEDHLRHCILDAAGSGSGAAVEAKVAEATQAIARLVRS